MSFKEVVAVAVSADIEFDVSEEGVKRDGGGEDILPTPEFCPPAEK